MRKLMQISVNRSLRGSLPVVIALGLFACSGTEVERETQEDLTVEEAVDGVETASLIAPTTPEPEVPTDRQALFEFLSSGEYRQFAASETGLHQSAGPHTEFGRPVRVFMNYAMASSLEAGNTEHPEGAAAVKELYEPDGETPLGWAVMLKTQADTAEGDGYFWYEIVSTTDPTAIFGEAGNGIPLCVGCHTTGSDYVLSEFPLN